MSTEEERRPISLKRKGDGLRIVWSDQSQTFTSWRTLRKNCPCATCNEERKKPYDPFKVLSAREVAAGAPAPLAMKAVGHYAYQISWNDGHNTGIYTLQALYMLNESPPAS